MDFSVYIVQDRDKSNQKLFDELAGDVGIGSFAKSTAGDIASDVVGTELIDIYSDPKIVGDTGIVISGDMISSVTIKKEITKREVFSGGGGLYTEGGTVIEDISNTLARTLVTTITVTGSLFAPDLAQNMNLSSVKLKNMARVLAWASLPQDYGNDDQNRKGDDIQKETNEAIQLKASVQQNYKSKGYKDYYFRRVLVTVYSSDEMQFRAVLHDNVYVASYEEKYTDKDGNGSFTLVMQTTTPSIYDVIVEGPTYSWNMLSVVDEIDTVATTVDENIVDTGARVIQTADKIMGLDGKLSDPVDKIADIIDTAFNTPSAIKNIIENPGKIPDNINKTLDAVDKVFDNVQDLKEEIPDLKETIKGASSASSASSATGSLSVALDNLIQTVVDDIFDAIDDRKKEDKS